MKKIWLALVFGFLVQGMGVAQGPGEMEEKKWFRGQLHAHSFWSDGHSFPEQALDAYRERGYHFVSLTEHNRFTDNPDAWRKVGVKERGWPTRISEATYEAYLREFEQQNIESRTDAQGTYVRLKTYGELAEQFEEPGHFLLLPGVELTQRVGNRDVHLNTINLPTALPSIRDAALVKKYSGMTVSELIAQNCTETARVAENLGLPYVLTLNHPQWRFYDVLPQDLIDNPEIRFFELCNNGSKFAPLLEWGEYPLDTFWDVVNAWRLSAGQPLLYGIGSDDAHFFDPERINGRNGVNLGWIMVRAPELKADALIAAMREGNFYATTGVILDDVSFDPTDKTLRVKIRPGKGENYRIRFIATQRGFDRDVTIVELPQAKGPRPVRSVPVYSEELGRTVKSVEGCEAEYRMNADDLYVRARVESDLPSRVMMHFYPKVRTAWTQPYANVNALEE